VPEGKAGDLSVSLSLSRNTDWLILRVELEARYVLDMIPNPGYPRSVISTAARDELIQQELLPPVRARSYRLRGLAIQGQAVPDIDVEVRPALHRLFKVDGILGYDFFQNYQEVRFSPADRRLTLIDP
jgi:hypothetical protein